MRSNGLSNAVSISMRRWVTLCRGMATGKVRKYTLKPAPRPQKQYRVRYEDELNQEQLEVVMAGDGPMLVIAGAGSGKTRTLTYRVSRLIEDGVDPSEILIVTFTNKASREMLSRVEQNYPHFMMYGPEIVNVFRRYKDRKRDANAMDFDDLLVFWKVLLDDHADVSAALKRRYRYILVDEYQDTNKLQADIIDSMATERRNLMVVGDDAQSIYSFRGASFENILTFPLRFPEAVIYKLETNYRSTRQILNLANASIANNRFQFS